MEVFVLGAHVFVMLIPHLRIVQLGSQEPLEIVNQWLVASLTLRPFRPVPPAVVTPNYKIIFVATS